MQTFPVITIVPHLHAVVFHGAEERALQVIGMAGVVQIRGNEPLRRHMERQIAHCIALAFDADMGTPSRW